jgi:hypothetical protein
MPNGRAEYSVVRGTGGVRGGLHTNWRAMLAEGKNIERCNGRESHLLLPKIKRRMEKRVKETM